MRGFPQVSVVVFDVNETLSDMAPLAARFVAVGAPAHAAPLWFASVLRDGFALTAAGAPSRFPVLAEGALRAALADVELDRDIDAAVAHIVDGFAQLGVHPDVPAGVRALSEGGARLVTLSNGAAEVPERLLAAAGLRDRFERCLSVDDAGAWKPARAAYAYAAETCGVAPAQMLLAAVHPWDIDGAARAGLATAWIDRGGAHYPGYFTSPDLAVTRIDALAERLRA
jgi:2-haloacid dehalogenase